MESSPPPRDTLCLTVEPREEGERLDAFLASRCPQFSRVQLRRSITAGDVTVDRRTAKPAYRLKAEQLVELCPPEPLPGGPEPEDIPLSVLYEDEDLVAIDKPPGMVVHPAKGHWSGTLAAAVAHRFQELSTVGGPQRPGIVHRLDRDTSGVILVARNDRAHLALARQFEERSTEKEYLALVYGVPDRDSDSIDQSIGPHPYQREKMAIRQGHVSREARTFYEVRERFAGFASLAVYPKTGRTHQIRVHLAHIGHPVVSDPLYSGRTQLTQGEISRTDDSTIVLDRTALHARRLKVRHPSTGEPLEIEAPLPADLTRLLEELRLHRQA